MNFLRRRISLFAKTAWLAAAVSVLTAALIIFFADAIHDRGAFSHRAGGAILAAELARRLGPAPTPESIARLAEEYDVELRYSSPKLSFATDDDMPDFNEVQIRKRHRDRRRHWHRGHGIALARGGGFLVALHRASGRALMVEIGERDGPWDDAEDIIAVLAAGAALLWLAFYFLQRKMLSPLAKLRDDMKAVSAGEWRETPVSQDDEIGDLAAVFNEMQRRLREMVQSKERLLIDASHELRSPLARLRLAAEFVKDESLRKKIAADIAELEELTGGILETSRLQNAAAPAKTPFSAAALLQTLREKYPRAQFLDAPEVFVRGDFSALARALGNLLDNAQKFAAATVIVKSEFQNGELIIAVQDDGPGAAEVDLPHLFEPFYRADTSRSRATGGFGLGLAIARAAVVAHGGNISATNKTPQGLEVCVRLPAQVAGE